MLIGGRCGAPNATTRGALAPEEACVAAVAAAAAALLLAAALNLATAGIVAAYLVLQVAYNHVLKFMRVADIAAIAAGFVLRALAGGVAIGVRISPWLLLATALLALFLAIAKRRGQVIALAGGSRARRRTVERYTLGGLDRALDAVTAATLVVYTAYGLVGAPTRWMLLTLPFVVFGVLRVRGALRAASRGTDDPALLALRDAAVLVAIAAWAATAATVAELAGA